MGVACETDESSIQGFGRETCGKEPLVRPRRNEEDITEVNLTERGWKGVGWIDLAYDGEKLAGCYEHGIEHSGSTKWGEFLG
jgi:hypothetical protein